MWSKNLKSSPPSAEETTTRLVAAAVLTQAEIPCVVWGEELLAWIHRVPTFIFYTLHLLVPESQLEKACQTLTSLLPEYVIMDPRDNYTDGWIFLPREEKMTFQELGRFPHASPLSRRLVHTSLASEKEANGTASSARQTDTPEYITLTPDSFFHLSATDPALVSLPEPIPPSLDKVRFPALPTLYDALLSTINAPERSEYSFGLRMQLKQYLGYLHLYCFSEYVRKWYKEVKDLPEPIREVGVALRPENKERFWKLWLREEPYSDDSDDDWRNGDD